MAKIIVDKKPTPFSNLAAGVCLTLLIAILLIFSEWLFFVTKPSFLLSANSWEQLRTLVVVPWILAIPAIITSIAIAILARTISPGLAARFLMLGASVLATILLMLMVDNFTYTLFSMRIFDLSGIARIAYLLLLITVTILINTRLTHWLHRGSLHRLIVWCSVVFIGAMLIVVVMNSSFRPSLERSTEAVQTQGLPNIIIFSADGLDVDRLSAFGYSRATSPFLEKIIGRGLVFENAFTNGATTTGSIGALLTGRLPTTTRVNFRPDLYRNEDSYRHLPGVLRTLGYHNAEMTVRYYIDAGDFNLRQAFHWANGRSLDQWVPIAAPDSLLRSWNFEIYFWQQIWDRISHRLRHIAGATEFADPYEEVTLKDGSTNLDSERLDQLRDFIRSSKEPFFINTHFMVSHGSRFPLKNRHFSAGQEQSEKWMVDFYDDAVLEVDQYLQTIYEFLEARGQLERTLIIFTTDHGERGTGNGSDQRLPLIFFFPNGEITGSNQVNAQRIDIAPTLLNYLGVEIPAWMEGDSLLKEQISPTRPILGTGTGPGKQVGQFFEIPNVEAPLYTLKKLYMIQCQQYWLLNLRTGRLDSKEVKGHTNPCNEDDMFNALEVKQYMIDHLIERNYPASALEKAAKRKPKVQLPSSS